MADRRDEPVYRGILGIDIEGYSRAEWTDPIRARLRDRLYRLLDDALGTADIAVGQTIRNDTGDGLWLLVSADVSTARLLHPLASSLVRRLAEDNQRVDVAERMRLRIAIHAGDMIPDPQGQAGASLVHAARLLDAEFGRSILRQSPDADAILIVSDVVYDGIVRHGYDGIDQAGWQPVWVEAKETSARAWVHLPGLARQPYLPPALEVSRTRRFDRTPVPEPKAGLPPDPKTHFVGREPELEELTRRLQQGGRLTVHGLGGIGKTQLVIRYLHQRRQDYPDGVFWLRADQESTLVGDLASLTWRLKLPERELADQEHQVEAVLSWLRQHPRLLLVLDNLEPAVQEAVRHWLPPGLPGHLLVTSRTPMGAARLELDPLPLDIARTFLFDRTGQTDAAAASDVAETLGCLPLALEQCAAYLEATGRDLTSYAELLRTRLLDLMAASRPEDYPRPVATTWQLSFERVEAEQPPAAALLHLAAFLAPDDIPISLLQAHAGVLPAELRTALVDAVEFDRAIAALRRYSLIERQGDGLRVHRLVQAVVRESLSADRRAVWLSAATRWLRVAFPADAWESPQHWPDCARLAPHVLSAEQLASGDSVEPRTLGWLLDHLGVYFSVRGDFTMGLPLMRRALELRERRLGSEHHDIAQSLNNLAFCLRVQGELTEARRLAERAVAVSQRVLGPDHPDAAAGLNTLANVLCEQGDVAAARVYAERALGIREAVLGPDHPDTAQSFGGLAEVLRRQGDLPKAAVLSRQALAVRARVFGPDDIRTANSLRVLGMVLWDQGNSEAARHLLEQALAIWERVPGASNARTAYSRLQLAILHLQTGNLTAAKPLMERSIVTLEHLLGPKHDWVLEGRCALQHLARASSRDAAHPAEL